MTDWKQVALRRAEFILQEARSNNPVYDQTISLAFRVISNWATIGSNGSSTAIKWKNNRISQAALDLYEKVSDSEWLRETINEHPEPLTQIWQWVLENKNSITAEEIIERIKVFPMVTITRDEDLEIIRRGFRTKGSPMERHAHISLRTDVQLKRRKRGV